MRVIATALLLLLTACGGGGGGGGSASLNNIPESLSFPHEPTGHYNVVNTPDLGPRHLPIYRDDRHLLVGVDQGADHLGSLPEVTERDDYEVRYGRLNDGAGRAVLASYFSDGLDGDSVVRRYTSRPVVRVIGSATAQERQRVLAAVQLVNAALPEGLRMDVEAPLPGLSLLDTVNDQGRRFVSGAERDGTIHVEFMPCAAYYSCGTSGGTGWVHFNYADDTISNSYVQMARGVPAYRNPRWGVILLAHEILHALGLQGHAPVALDTIMAVSNDVYQTRQGTAQPVSLLYPADREALRVLYGEVAPGDSVNDLGAWASTSLHIAGTGEHAAFGVALRNGYAEPWVYGLRPSTDLADNAALSGSATWRGALLGLTPAAASVAGDAEIGVDLAAMTGRADFTELETWDAAPGEAGTGAQWLDGDLGYTISVHGNTFVQTGGDSGVVTGVFLGAAHEGVGGTVERTDLTAAFGGQR